MGKEKWKNNNKNHKNINHLRARKIKEEKGREKLEKGYGKKEGKMGKRMEKYKRKGSVLDVSNSYGRVEWLRRGKYRRKGRTSIRKGK